MISKFLFVVSIFLCLQFSQVDAKWLLKDTVEFQPRAGLPNFFKKLKNGEPTKIGFLGGSITAANGWRPKIVEFMKSYYKNDSIVDYNAGIGATDSKYGVFRIGGHLLDKDIFDLIFVEFAVNDWYGSSDNVEKSMEGIVRKIWAENPRTDICFVYTVTSIFLDDLNAGKMNLSTTKHDSIASYYSIPSVLWGTKCIKLLQTDSVIFDDSLSVSSKNAAGKNVFTVDNTHPTSFGYQIYTDVLSKCLRQIDENDKTKDHILSPPLWESNYENSRICPVNKMFNHGMYELTDAGDISYLDNFTISNPMILVADKPEQVYEFDFNGDEIGLNLIKGPSTGRFIVEVDSIVKEYCSFTGICSNWRRTPVYIKLSKGLHHVKIYPSTNQLTLKEKENILYSAAKSDIIDNPTKYEKNELIFSDIFINGELTNICQSPYPEVEDESICSYGKTVLEGLNGKLFNWYSTTQSIDVMETSKYFVTPYLDKTTKFYVSNIDSGCESLRKEVVVTVDVIPQISFTDIANFICSESQPIVLEGLPKGGFFSGEGVDNNIFSPKNAGLGKHAILYTYKSSGGCVVSKSDMTIVYDTIGLTVVDTIKVFEYIDIAVTDTLIIDLITSVTELDKLQIKIYPNPSSDFVIIDTKEYLKIPDYSLIIQSLSGQVVFNSKINVSKFRISIDQFGSAGTYLVTILDPSGDVSSTKKIIINKN